MSNDHEELIENNRDNAAPSRSVHKTERQQSFDSTQYFTFHERTQDVPP